MDREQEEIQFLGFFGILKESYNIVSSWTKIFTQITLSLILPLSFIYLAHIQISEYLFANIMHDETPEGIRSYDKLSRVSSSEWTLFLLFKIGYFIFFIILALLSTSAVVYTVACIYTAKEITFRKVMSVVPKVWKRLMITFIWNFVFVFGYNCASLAVLALVVFVFVLIKVVGVVLVVLFVIVYLIGFFYITIVWQLASVVSVLEESYGLNAMAKSRALIKGKMGISGGVYFALGLCFFGVQVLFKSLVVVGDRGIGSRIGYGVVCVVLLSINMLFGLITQTIVYFVCKSYHHENIDKSSLANHLGGYLGEYVALKNTKDVQLEQFEV